MVADQIDDAHDTAAAGHAHIHLYTVLAAFVNGHQVIPAIYGVGDHLGRNHLVLLEKQQSVAFQCRRVLGQVTIGRCQLMHLTLQIEVAQGEFLIDLGQREERLQGSTSLVELSHCRVGR